MNTTPIFSSHRRALLNGALLGLVATATPHWVQAQVAYPSQTIRIVVPFTAGSGTDVIARAVGEQIRKGVKQSVIVDNKPGAGGTLGASQVASAPADGYTVLVHSAGHVANAALFPQLRYDTLKDFTPVTMLAVLPNVLVSAPGRYKTVQELVAKARSPGQAMYASAGNGSATHMNAEKFLAAVGGDATHVPFRGTPEALTEVMAGRLDWFFAPLVSALPLIKDGKLVALGVGTPHRSPALPDVPTTLELGYAGSDYTFWVGMFVPVKTPPPVVARLHEETVQVLRSDAIRERLAGLGAEVAPMEQPQFAALVDAEAVQAAALIKRAGIRVE